MRNEKGEMNRDLLDSQRDTEGGVNFLHYWYESASIASRFNSSAWRLISSSSSCSVILGFLVVCAGVNARMTFPAGISWGTLIFSQRSAGISTVWVMVMDLI